MSEKEIEQDKILMDNLFSKFENKNANMSIQQKLKSFADFLILEKGLENKAVIFWEYLNRLEKEEK
jgi:hypothetical protein